MEDTQAASNLCTLSNQTYVFTPSSPSFPFGTPGLCSIPPNPQSESPYLNTKLFFLYLREMQTQVLRGQQRFSKYCSTAAVQTSDISYSDVTESFHVLIISHKQSLLNLTESVDVLNVRNCHNLLQNGGK